MMSGSSQLSHWLKLWSLAKILDVLRGDGGDIDGVLRKTERKIMSSARYLRDI